MYDYLLQDIKRAGYRGQLVDSTERVFSSSTNGILEISVEVLPADVSDGVDTVSRLDRS